MRYLVLVLLLAACGESVTEPAPQSSANAYAAVVGQYVVTDLAFPISGDTARLRTGQDWMRFVVTPDGYIVGDALIVYPHADGFTILERGLFWGRATLDGDTLRTQMEPMYSAGDWMQSLRFAVRGDSLVMRADVMAGMVRGVARRNRTETFDAMH